MKKKYIIIGIIVVVVLVLGYLGIHVYNMYSSFMKTQTIPIDNNLTVVLGGGGNSGLLVTDSTVVVIDTKMMKPAEELYKLAKEKAGQRKIIVINTHFHPDHTGGNQFYKGCKIYMGNYDKDFLQKHLKSGQMPTDLVNDSLFLNLGNETVELFNLGQAHTLNDVVVYLKNRKMLFTGDLVFNKRCPVLNKESNANVDKWINVLNTIISKWDINQLIPGHGDIGGKELAANLKQYFIDMKTAADNPDKKDEMIAKYSDWMSMPGMASPGKTIKYIKNSK